jgi:hypothetical protein
VEIFAVRRLTSDQVLCRIRLALRRKSGPRIALPAHRLHYPVARWPRSTTHHTGLLRRSPITEMRLLRDHTMRASTRAHAATAALSNRLRFFMCRLVLCGSSAGQSRRKKRLSHPGRELRGCMHTGGEQRGHLASSSTRQANELGRMSRRASRIWYWFVQSRASRADAWSTRSIAYM